MWNLDEIANVEFQMGSELQKPNLLILVGHKMILDTDLD